jgi:hypothetical protein
MKSKEPDFMKELHRIRARLTKEWKKMSDKEFLVHMHKIGKDFKESLRFRRTILTPHS